MTSIRTTHGLLTAELSQHAKDGPPRTLSRSPHPYHRRSTSLQKKPEEVIDQALARYNESSDTTESEERATEADDEKGPILKGLPAPPLRGRKGLRGSKTPLDVTPSISPFPTPPAFDDRRPSYFANDRTRKVSKVDHGAQERALEKYKKYVKKRRAEVARRCTEAILLGLIGSIACSQAHRTGALKELFSELLSSLVGLAVLYFLFPVRIAFRRFRGGKSLFGAVRAGFRIPSAFDPGSLMYPVFLPFFISSSLLPIQSTVLITNIILGLSSVPQKVIPFDSAHASGLFYWAFSSIPIAQGTFRVHRQSHPDYRAQQLGKEGLILLCPLHQATLSTLKYLTSTSLDPAEIQLLSTGLINLYLFAISPQAEILKALVWVGALCLFILCQKPLSWEVRLARIPSWKFTRNKSPKTGLLSVFEDMLNLVLPRYPYKQTQDLASDDEDYEHLKSARKMAKNQGRLRKAKTGGPQSELEPILSEKENDHVFETSNGLQRPRTLSGAGSNLPLLSRRRQISLSIPASGFLSLTYIQAQACKWLISVYVLLASLAIVLVVVRSYVSTQALSSHEPFGWALGYLFGDIQPLRLWVVSNNLDTWVALPSHKLHNTVAAGMGWVEQVRQTRIGPANTRLLLAAYCLVILTTGIGMVLQLGTVAEVDTRRKVFHSIMVAMLLPAIFVDPCFIALALSLILAIFLLLDLYRAAQMPPISKPLTTFLAPYVDGRDYRGPVIVSPMFLLIGCAIPLWLSLAGASRRGQDPWSGWDTDVRELSMISGVVCVGMGDAAASLIGRRYGKTKWFWGGGKSLEGSAAFAIAVVIGLAASYSWLRIGGWVQWEMRAIPDALFKMALAGSGASILETVLTAGNDNVIVPIGLWLMTRGLGI